MRIDQLLGFVGDGFTYYPELVRRYEISVNAAVMLGFLGWRDVECDADGWRALNTKDITKRTGLSIKEQGTARKQLRDAGLIEEEYARLDHVLRFRIMKGEIPEGGGPSKWPNAESANGETPNQQMAKRPNGVSHIGEEIRKNKEEPQAALALSVPQGTDARITGLEDSTSMVPPAKPRRPGAFVRPTLEEVKAFAVSQGLPALDGSAFFYGKEGNGWKGVKDWRATLKNWKFHGYLPSQKAGRNNGGGALNYVMQ